VIFRGSAPNCVLWGLNRLLSAVAGYGISFSSEGHEANVPMALAPDDRM